MSKKVAVVTFGRLNPPSRAHRMLVDTLIQEGKQAAQNADVSQVSVYLLLSPSHDSKKNPLPYEFRARILDDLIEDRVHIGMEAKPRTLIEAMTALDKEGFTEVTVVVGSDRVAEFQDLLDKYNGEPDKKGNLLYEFDAINVVQAGSARDSTSAIDPDSASDLSAVSATALRQAAADNDFDTFLAGFFDPEDTDAAREVFEELQRQMGVEVEEEPSVEDELADEAEEADSEQLEETRRRVYESAKTQALHESVSGSPLREGYRDSRARVRLVPSDESYALMDVAINPAVASTTQQLAEAVATGITYLSQSSTKPFRIELTRLSASDQKRIETSLNRGLLLREALRMLRPNILQRVEVTYKH